LSRAAVELGRDRIQPILIEPEQVGALGKVLAERPVGVLVGAPLPRAARVTETEIDLHLTPTEWQLLEQLVRNPGKLVSQRDLLLKIWGPKYVDETHYLRQYMAQLRRKLEPDPARPRHLLTELGMGYRYQP